MKAGALEAAVAECRENGTHRPKVQLMQTMGGRLFCWSLLCYGCGVYERLTDPVSPELLPPRPAQ